MRKNWGGLAALLAVVSLLIAGLLEGDRERPTPLPSIPSVTVTSPPSPLSTEAERGDTPSPSPFPTNTLRPSVTMTLPPTVGGPGPKPPILTSPSSPPSGDRQSTPTTTLTSPPSPLSTVERGDIATPTVEFCEAVTIEYEVVAATLNIRSGRGTNFPVIGTMREGDTFIGSLCVDPDTANIYYWTKILEPGHPLAGGWAAYLAVNGSGRFLR